VNASLASGRVEAPRGAGAGAAEPLRAPAIPAGRAGRDRRLRLRYRYLDLRREVMSQRCGWRHRLTRSMRALARHPRLHRPRDADAHQGDARGGARLPGAEPHPSGTSFALPQSPQIFKQLLMIAGFDRYYQIVRCFRREDLRADRQPEIHPTRHRDGSFSARTTSWDSWKSWCAISSGGAGTELTRPFPAAHLRAGAAPLRLRQARPAHPAGAGGRRESW